MAEDFGSSSFEIRNRQSITTQAQSESYVCCRQQDGQIQALLIREPLLFQNEFPSSAEMSFMMLYKIV